MKIIKRREYKESVSYSRDFDFEDAPGSGYGFTCDEKGEPEVRARSFEACLTGIINDRRVIDRGVTTHHHSYVEPAVGECACGRHVYLGHFTNTCECGRDYNSAGQMLAPRSQWGEETGESAADILAIDGMTTDQLFDD